MVWLIVYVDVLIFLNIIIDYLLLCLCSSVISQKPKLLRIVIGSVIGGISSLMIFLPKMNPLIEALLSLIFAVIIIFATYWKIPFLKFLKAVFCLYFSSFILAGGLFYVAKYLNLKSIAINNSVIYLNISPILLITLTIIFYFIFFLFSKIFKPKAEYDSICDIELYLKEKSFKENAIIDSGNSYIDYFSNSEVIFCDADIFDLIKNSQTENDNRFRTMPCSTVTGTQLLEGLRIDKAILYLKNREIELVKPIIIKADGSLPDEYKCILNPKILN